MKLNFITMMVRNLEKSLAFYEGLVGLQKVNAISLDAGEIVFLANSKGETMIELIEFPDVEKIATKGLFMSYTATAPLEEIRQKALDMGYSPSEIFTEGTKPNYFTLTDPDGVVVEFGV